MALQIREITICTAKKLAKGEPIGKAIAIDVQPAGELIGLISKRGALAVIVCEPEGAAADAVPRTIWLGIPPCSIDDPAAGMLWKRFGMIMGGSPSVSAAGVQPVIGFELARKNVIADRYH